MRLRIFESPKSYWVAQSDLRLGELLEDRTQRIACLRAAEEIWRDQLAPRHPWLLRARELLKREEADMLVAGSRTGVE
jgi:hypothetical protein